MSKPYKPIKTLSDLEALSDQWRRGESEPSHPRNLSLQAVHGSPPRVLSGDEANKEQLIKIRPMAKTTIVKKCHEHSPCDNKYKNAANKDKVKRNPRKNSKIAANLNYKVPPAAAAETESLLKIHKKEIPTARPKISTKHSIERVWERSPPSSPPRDAEHHHSNMYPSPTTTPDSPDADV